MRVRNEGLPRNLRTAQKNKLANRQKQKSPGGNSVGGFFVIAG